MTVTLFRPLHMLFTEPIVTFVCLYISLEFATLFVFLAAIPYIFETIYSFTLDQSGLILISVLVGSFLGILTIILCDGFIYRRQVVHRYPPNRVPPEHRLYPAMMGSMGPVAGLFWFGWTARSEISPWSPAIAIVPFSWGYICIFVSLMQFGTDSYAGATTASVASANTFARYGLAGAFPLFTLRMYRTMGTDWATSLFGFVAVLLMSVPFVLFKFGKVIRSKSRYETATW